MSGIIYWNESEFIAQRDQVEEVRWGFEGLLEKSLPGFYYQLPTLIEKYDNNGVMADCVARLKKIQSRLTNLGLTMDQYLEDYNQSLEDGKKTMGQVEVQNDVYGTFGTMVAGGGALGALYAGSKAYQYYQTGKKFSTEFNHMWQFVNSGTYELASFGTACSEVGDYAKLIGEYFVEKATGGENVYVQERLEASLKSVLASVPSGSYCTFFDADWDAIGKSLGIDNLADKMKELGELIHKTLIGKSKKGFSALYGALEGLQTLLSLTGQDAAAKAMDGLVKALKTGKMTASNADYYLNVFASFMGNYTTQVSYIESMQAAMDAAGYGYDNPINVMLDQLKEEYTTGALQGFNMAMDKLDDALLDYAKKGVGEAFPPLKVADICIDCFSKVTTAVYGQHRVDATKEIMGYLQFDNVLTTSLENYVQLMNDGVADAADVAQADKVLELLYTTKVKEYEAIENIAYEYNEWEDLAELKLKELEEFKKTYFPDPETK